MEGRTDPRLAKHLDEFPLGELIEAGKHVVDLLEHPGWVFVQDLLTHAHGDGIERLKLGTILSKSEYAQKLGVLNGLSLAADAAETVIQKAGEARRALEESEARPVAEKE